MAIQENVAINFVTSYQGKGLKQAETQVGQFEVLAKKAAKTFTELFAVKKVYDFGKASVDAFTADQKALALLDQTLVNVGLGFQALGIDKYITEVSMATGVTKESLIPAFETLARYTGNIAKSQKLLSLALDVSAGTGKDLQTVTLALGKAYGGNTTALGKLGAGLDKATLNSKNFALVQDALSTKFAGDAATAADTYSGKIAKLNVAFKEMQVIVGEGLVTGFQNLSGQGAGLDKSITMIQNLGYVISGFVQSVGGGLGWIITGIEKLINNPVTRFFMNLGKKSGLNVIGDWFNLGKTAAYNELLKKNTTLLQKAYAQQTNSLKTSTAQLAVDKASLVLKQASKVLDLTAIQEYAALQQAQTADDKNRLQLMQALLDQNATAASNFAQKVLAANGLVMDLQGNITNDPFAQWAQSLSNLITDLTNAQNKISSINSIVAGTGGNNGLGGVNPSGVAGEVQGSITWDSWMSAASTAATSATSNPVNITNNYSVNAAGMVGTAADFAAAINYSIVDSSGSGVATNLSRVNSSLLGPKIS